MNYPQSTPRGILFHQQNPPTTPLEAAKRGWGTQDIYVHFRIDPDRARDLVWEAERERLEARKG